MPQTFEGKISKNIIAGIAITTMIFIVSVHLSVFGFFCALLLPLPVLFYRSKLGRTAGVAIPAGSVLVMAVIFGRISVDILFFSELLLAGFVLSELIEMNLSVERTVLYACGVVLLTGLAFLILHSNFSQKGIVPLVSQYVGENLRLTLMLYREMGVSEESIRIISDSLEHIQYVLVRILPSLAVSLVLFVVWVTLLMARPILKLRGLFCPDFGSLSLWKVPDTLVWAVIGCGGILLVPDSAFKIFGMNGLIILMMIYFFGGIAIVSFYFKKKKFPLALRFFLYSLIALQQFILLFVIGLGFFDMWLNFRKLEKK